MAFHPFEVDAVHLAYTILGAFVVIFGLFSGFIKEKLYLGEAPIATVTGIILGPHVLGLFDPIGWTHEQHTIDYITLEVTRVVIAIGVFAIGVELPKAVVGGKFADKHVPSHIRHLLSAESGCNDGAAFPFLYIALFLTLDKSAGHAVGEWFYYTWVYEIIMGTLIGTLLGWSVRKVMQFSERKKIIDRQSFVAQYVSLAILSIGICTLLGSDDLLAAFACGTAFAWDGAFNKATEDSMFSNVIDLLFNCACFIYIGAIIPFKDFGNAAFHLSVWRLIVLAILILLLRRMPIILALYKFIPDLKTFHEAVFVGWFGPMGVGAIFIATLARHHIPEPVNDGDTSQVDLLQETIVPVVSMLVLASVLTHGLSIPFFMSGRRVHTLTYTWSRNPSIATNNEPAWTTHARRIIPGQDVEINRDEEEGDLGMQHRMEKSSHGDTTDSSHSGSQTRTIEGQGEKITEKRTRDGEEHVRVVNDGAGTPPIAEYREGHDLIIEHRDGADDCDVTTHVVKNAFRDNGEPHSKFEEARDVVHNIIHSRPGSRSSRFSRQSRESGHSMTPVASIDSEHADDGFVRRETGDGKNIIELPPNDSPRPARVDTPPSPRSGAPPVIVTDHAYDSDSEHSTNAGSDYEDNGGRRPYAHLQRPSVSSSRDEPSVSRTQSTRDSLPHVHSYIPAERLAPKKETGGWRRFLGVGRKPQSSHHAAEEGRARPSTPDSDDGGFKRVPTTRSVHRTATLDPNEGGIPLTRTLSRAISFAPDIAPSSDTAPSIGNNGNNAPGFKRNPDLSLFRSSSIRFADDEDDDDNDNGGGQSVSFAEPKK
ncbi:Na+/H+ exchanger AnNHA1 [Trichosporon asahii var. asahii CBS 2479]|uniref:Na+/H+ exchanger AnNHA1 n=1 Tax=Trichosporon asahii var. asahii (strain ATCC 90039 / CBS 2479 / JCM 2466 / KCTC 7840 / NBRC 103889/ NCYC 2677 / UAMH 7654) TaxID=1186058 RepID=J5T5A6_TRIAS|nr:Na+/H+ exchanger AnNHA1 [Trichosporon asahii var. asahii CBS 2479]EJT49251.1 Na+/H+ exchanger AnNHA1 [Trichosporon asahii var. asahii CBS 2479]